MTLATIPNSTPLATLWTEVETHWPFATAVVASPRPLALPGVQSGVGHGGPAQARLILQRGLTRLAKASAGTRNDTLYRVDFRLAQLVLTGQLQEGSSAPV